MAFQGKEHAIFVRLASGGTPVLGLTHADVVPHIVKSTGAEFVLAELDANEFLELGDGFYKIVWSESRMNTLGSFMFTLQGDDFDSIVNTFEILPNPVDHIAAPPYCVVSGNMVDLTGEPPNKYHEVRFELAKRPTVSGYSIVSADVIVTRPDINGNFAVKLIRGAKVVLYIPQSAIRHTITVPDMDSSNIIDILPPIP